MDARIARNLAVSRAEWKAIDHLIFAIRIQGITQNGIQQYNTID